MALQFDNIGPARLLIWIMKCCGMWHFKSSTWNTIYRCYGWILHFHFTFLFILAMYINVGMSQSINDLSDALYMSLTETALVVKVLNAMRKSKQIVEFMEIFEQSSEGTPWTDEELETVRKAHAGFCRLRNPHIIGSLTVLLFAFSTPLYDTTYALPFPCWIPFDYRNDEKYFYAYGYVVVGMIVTCTSNFTMDLFQSFLLLQIANCYKLLGHRFEKFGNKGDKGDESMLDRYFTFHSSLVSLTAKCEGFLSIPVLIQSGMSAFVICFTIYKIQNITFAENPNAFIMFIIFGLIMGLQIYLPCNYGNELTSSANDLTNAIYSSGWIQLQLNTRKKIFIYMEYLKRPIVVRAGKIMNIGLGVFSQTMNNAYRLYALLLNIQS